MRAKLVKILISTLLTLLLLLALVYILVRSRPVQEYIVDKLTTYLSEEMGTRVSISGVDIEFFKTVVFEDVFVGDKQQDTIFYINKLKADLSAFDNVNHRVILKYLKLDNALVNFVKHRGQDEFNYEFFFRFFEKKDTTPNPNPVIWTIGFDRLILENTRFVMQDENAPPGTPGIFDPSHFSFYDINADFKRFRIIDDSLNFHINKLATRELCGLQVRSFEADAVVSSSELSFNNLDLTTEFSRVRRQVMFTYASWKEMGYFIEKVKLKGDLVRAEVDSRDIAYFSPELKDYNKKFVMNGQVTGRVNKLKARDFYLEYGEKTYVMGDFFFDGLPDFNTTFIELTLDKVQTNRKDLEALAMQPMPDNLSSLGTIRFSGQFTGFVNDFVAYGKLNSDIGSISSDINLKLGQKKANARYSGTLSSTAFDLGKFLGQESTLGKITMKGSVKGKGLTEKSVKSEYTIDIESFDVKGYTYRNVKSEGSFDTSLFSGEVYVKDDNIDLDFNGTVLLSRSAPIFNFNADIKRANLQALHLDTALTIVSGKINSNFTGNSLDNINGSFIISDVHLFTQGKQFDIKQLGIRANAPRSRYHELVFASDFASGSIKGDYNFSNLPASMQNFAGHLLPDLIPHDELVTNDEEFTYDIYIKDASVVTNFLLPGYNVKDLVLKGHYSGVREQFTISGTIGRFYYHNYVFSNIGVEGNKPQGDRLNLITSTGPIYRDDSLLLNNSRVNVLVHNNNITYAMNLNDSGARDFAELHGDIRFSGKSISLKTYNSVFAYNNLAWHFNNDNEVLYIDSNRIRVTNLRLHGTNNQSLVVHGMISDRVEDQLNIDSIRVNLQILNPLLPNGISLAGLINGRVELKKLLNEPVMESNIRLDRVVINKDTLGDVRLYSSNSGNMLAYKLEGLVLNGRLAGLNLKGEIDTREKGDNYAIDITMPESDITILQNFLNDYVTSLKGYASADIKVRGTFEKPELKGSISLKEVSFTENYLKARLRFSNTIELDDDKIILGDEKIYDERNHTATIGGTITHKAFSDFNLNLHIRNMDDFHVLHTTLKDNQSFYGDAYVDGSVTIRGPLNNIAIGVNATSRRDTKIFIPLTSGSEAGKYAFITFENEHDSTPKLVAKSIRDLTDLTLDLNLNVTNDAEVQLVFDPTLGDKITARGNGNIRLYMNSFGEFKMYGNYTIDEGNYLFTAINVFQKPFNIEKGSTLSWNGDPLNARINVKAAYSLRARPYELVAGLLPETELEDLKTPVPVDCRLILSGRLLKPDIRFGINIKDMSATVSATARNAVQDVVKKIETDQEELNRQVFALLLFRSFVTPQYLQTSASGTLTASDAYNTTVDDLVTAQLNNWLSGVGQKQKVQIGVDLQRNQATDKQDVYLTGNVKFLKERLILDVSYDATNNLINPDVQYLVSKDGRLRLRAFSRSTINPYYNYNINTQGVGIFYRKEFDTFLPRRKPNAPADTSKKQPVPVTPPVQPADSVIRQQDTTRTGSR